MDCAWNHARTLERAVITVGDLEGNAPILSPSGAPDALRSLTLRVVGTRHANYIASGLLQHFLPGYHCRQMAVVYVFVGHQYSTRSSLQAMEHSFNRKERRMRYWDVISKCAEKVQQMAVRFESGDSQNPIEVDETSDIEGFVHNGLKAAGGYALPVQFDCLTYGPLLLWDQMVNDGRELLP
jgi:hypothetical protein